MPSAPAARPITHILCPVDFSDSSAHAVGQAVALAGWYQARITALHVFNPLAAPAVEPLEESEEPRAEIERLRDQAAASFRAATTAGIQVDAVVDIGRPAARIIERAKELPADLIVMGTHGASGFEHLFLGSVAEKVLRKATCPVLTVPPRATSTSTVPFRQVLCAVDFSDPSLAAFELGSSIAQRAGAAVTLLHVIEWPWPEPPAPELKSLPAEQAAALAEYRRYLETTARTRLDTTLPDALKARGARPVIRHGKPYTEILRVAEEEKADLLVVGVHGRNPIDLTLFGSTTNQLVRRATCPVLTLRQ
jgi:nucleotide-binding universal stress UspA family protein